MSSQDEFGFERNPYAAPEVRPLEPWPSAKPELGDIDGNPFLTIWTRPRATIRQIVARDPKQYLLPLVFLSGVGDLLDQASIHNLGAFFSVSFLVLAALLFGFLFGLFQLLISAFCVKFTGQMFNGRANQVALRAAIAWASIPAICGSILYIPEIGIFGGETFTDAVDSFEAQPLLWIPFTIIQGTAFVLGMWSFIICCHTVAELQGYRSAWTGFWNLIFAFLVGLLLVLTPIFLLLIFSV